VRIFVSMARRSAIVALAAGLVMALLMSTGPTQTEPSAKRLSTYTPVTGATFNRPVGTSWQQRAIFRHINKTIDSTPAGATIRFAVFSFAEYPTATKLIAAAQRGVNVQLIFDDHIIYKQEARLRRALGKNANAKSFVVYCHLSCRGTSGNMHDKMFLFSQAGSAQNIVMVGSDNITRHNAVDQWSDAYTVVGDAALYFTYAGVFDQMKYDRPQTTPYIRADINGYEPQFYPYPGTTEATDPVYEALEQIQCTGATLGVAGTDTGNTMVRLSQHAWNGSRGVYLSRKVASLEGEGCDVQIIYGVGIGARVRSILRGAGIPMSYGTHKGIHTHQKTMLVSGVYAGDPAAHIVWTGSHNWSNGALKRDEIIFKISDQAAYDQYYANWEDIWANG
jgi:phosphatidylserine/phosphatidylglycerophosphate/cardiolipin synthase-like enzyme